MAPRFVRIVRAMPVTATNKVHRVALRREGFRSTDPVWWNGAGGAYRPLGGEELAGLLAEYEAHGRTALLSSISPMA